MIKHTYLFIVTIVTFFISNSLYASQSSFRLEQIVGLHNFPSTEVYAIHQDNDGYIWIATELGLYQFDGYKLNEYRSNLNNQSLLSANKVTCLYEVDNEKLMIGTSRGLSIYNLKTGIISISEASSLENNFITSVVQDHQGNVWLGTEHGVFIYDMQKDSCRSMGDKFRAKVIKDLMVDSKGHIWIGTWDAGLFRYHHKEDKFFKYPKLNDRNSAHVIFEDSNSQIWVGSFGKGLHLLHQPYNLAELKWTTYTEKNTNSNLIDNHIYSISENKDLGVLMVGTRRGVSIIPIDSSTDVDTWSEANFHENGEIIRLTDVDAIINDFQQNVWIGSVGRGIRCLKSRAQGFKTMVNPLKKISSSTTIRSIASTSDQVFIGVGSDGLGVCSKKNTGYNLFFSEIDFIGKTDFLRINDIALLGDHQALLASSNGYFCYDFLKDGSVPILVEDSLVTLRPVFSISPSIDGGQFFACKNRLVYQSKDKKIHHIVVDLPYNLTSVLHQYGSVVWVGTDSDGIYKLKVDSETKKIISKKHYCIANNRLKSDEVNCLYLDSQKRVWVGTNGAGLCCYDLQSDCFISINDVSRLSSDVIVSIIEDKEGVLWLGSNVGLIKFFPSSNLTSSEYIIYDKSDGLPDNCFLPRAVTKDKDDQIYFGTHNGYFSFNPQLIINPEVSGKVLVTEVLVDNQPISKLEREERESISKYLPSCVEQINIPSKYSNFTFEFSPMSHFNPDNVRYAYKLVGYDKEWQYTDYTKRFAHYANLPSGRYQFVLKSTTEYGVWSERLQTFKVRVIPPLWETWWAYTIYVIIIVSIIVFLNHSAKQRLELRAQLRIKSIEQEKQMMLNHEKLRFFTNVTHELFTPITIVAASMEELKEVIPYRKAEVVMSNINRLIRLIQQILEFRKAETGNLKLEVRERDLIDFVKNNVESFIPMMNKKGVNVIFNAQHEYLPAYFDGDKLDKILYNLLSNALKYNEVGAQVDVDLTCRDQFVTISVSDNGEGLSERAMKNLFKRFYDGDYRRHETSGTGIGLSLVNDLVTLHKGEIRVDNRPGEGVRFIFTLPISLDNYSENEVFVNDIVNTDTALVEEEYELLQQEPSVEENVEKKSTIMLVEDDVDLSQLLSNLLGQYYNIISSANGVEALEKLRQEDVDLVISDLMMPELDGLELCLKIKNDAELSHLPVLLLTAKSDNDTAASAYDAGVDSFMSKPFAFNILIARVRNLLNMRQQRIAKFQNQPVIELKKLDYSSHEESFLAEVMDVIQNNFGDPDLDQNKLSEILGLSKSTLHRKLKALTGMTASNLVRDTRMRYAYELLSKKGGGRVSEIAYAVGFNDPKYFSICFKKKYGVLPSEIAIETKEKLV